MRVLSRLGGWLLGAALTIGCGEPAPLLPAMGRPASVSQGPRVAVIVAVRGEVRVVPGEGDGFAARPELQLLRDDRLTVEPGSFVVVALHNGYLVRLNEGSALRVDALASFNDAPTGTDLEQRFSSLLSPSEREDEDLRRSITRVAGWNTRMTAAETIPTQSATQRVATPIGSGKDQDGLAQGEAVGSPLPASTPIAERADRVELPAVTPEPVKVEAKMDPPMGGGRSEGPKRGRDDSKAKADDSDDQATSHDEKSSPPSVHVLDLPRIVVHRSELDGERTNVSLPGPLQLQRFELARCAGKGAVIRGQIKARKLVALEVGGVASKCVPAVLGKAVALTDGWIEMNVL